MIGLGGSYGHTYLGSIPKGVDDSVAVWHFFYDAILPIVFYAILEID